MTIIEVKAIPLYVQETQGGWEDEITHQDNMQTLVEIVTDDGLRGYGSAYTSVALVEGSLRLLRNWLIGETHIEPERITETLHQKTFWQGRGGAVTHAISAVDQALWDLFGKITGQPVARLLGGYYRDRIKPYGSILFEEPESLRNTLNEVTARGFKAVKLGWGPFGRVNRMLDEAMVRTARETVGDDVEIMVDAGASESYWKHGYKWALETAKMLADYQVVWFEEALPPDDLEGYIKLREHSPVKIASGEVLTRRQSFMTWIERGAVDIIQPDCTKVGGLSEARRIAWMAYDHHIQVVPHGWNTAVGLATDLHLVASLPVAQWVEYFTPSPFIEDLVKQPFKLQDGLLVIPTAPGLGIELDPNALQTFSRPRGL